MRGVKEICFMICLFFSLAHAEESKHPGEYDEQLIQNRTEAFARMGWSSDKAGELESVSSTVDAEKLTGSQSSDESGAEGSVNAWLQPNPWAESSQKRLPVTEVAQSQSEKGVVMTGQKTAQPENIFLPKLVQLPSEKNQNSN